MKTILSMQFQVLYYGLRNKVMSWIFAKQRKGNPILVTFPKKYNIKVNWCSKKVTCFWSLFFYFYNYYSVNTNQPKFSMEIKIWVLVMRFHWFLSVFILLIAQKLYEFFHYMLSFCFFMIELEVFIFNYERNIYIYFFVYVIEVNQKKDNMKATDVYNHLYFIPV